MGTRKWHQRACHRLNRYEALKALEEIPCHQLQFLSAPLTVLGR
jgi:hypothetical protein